MLPRGFQFSQSSLQDYVDCHRRFQLRYVDGQVWPAVQAEPLIEHEQHLDLGTRFHRLVERHQLGLPADVLRATIMDDQLRAWWDAYLEFDFLHQIKGTRYPEFTLSTNLAGSRLAATYDLLLVLPSERIYIFDWKTYRTMPPRQWFESRLQTKIYPYILAVAGHSLFREQFHPDQITMIYWVTGAPDQPARFEYSVGQYEADRAYLSALVGEVQSKIAVESLNLWALTADEARCRFCEYRSLCERGVVAGSVSDLEEFDVLEANMPPGGLAFGLADVDEVGF